jgi:hypothetical protein
VPQNATGAFDGDHWVGAVYAQPAAGPRVELALDDVAAASL